MSGGKVIPGLYPVIMAGGKGTRFWPLSRESFPKQFLRLVGERTLLQETIGRLQGKVAPKNVLIVTTEGQRDIVQWQLRQALGTVNSVVEPEGRNTAPAIALSAFKIHKRKKDAILLVLPSDHHIGDPEAFASTVRKALPYAKKGGIVTFGVRPNRAETGYGYIKAGARLASGVFRAERFVEKPDRKKAAHYLKDGSYYWNSGMFLFGAETMLGELRKHMPDIYGAFNGIRKHLNTPDEDKALRDVYSSMREESIDYGVMEKSTKVVVVAAEFDWSDIGSWNALEDVMDTDSHGNVISGHVVDMDTKGSILFAGKRLLATIGLRDMVVVDTADATLVVPKDKVQRVKDLVRRLKLEGKEEYLSPMIEERPWGHFSVLEKGDFYKIKHICINPGGRLSLQSHNHRSEHWIVVSGTARVTRDDEVFSVHRNESTYIPPAVKHRLENRGRIPLRIIEIQSGEYLEEDDIIRYEDGYGRRSG